MKVRQGMCMHALESGDRGLNAARSRQRQNELDDIYNQEVPNMYIRDKDSEKHLLGLYRSVYVTYLVSEK